MRLTTTFSAIFIPVVLNRFTGTVAVVDVHAAAEGRATLARQIPLEDMLVQSERRQVRHRQR